jgi:hypothetical protein
MIAKAYGQDPRDVARWEPDWLAACSTAMAAETGAENERQRRAERRRRASAGGRG